VEFSAFKKNFIGMSGETMEKWMVAAKKADFNRLAKTFSISPVLARIMINRGLKTDEEFQQFLYGDLSALHRPEKMKDMDRGVECIRRSIDGGQLICIASDFDVDGVFSGYILWRGIHRVAGPDTGRVWLKQPDCTGSL
jgi:single-stranded-DNA-specific exonuclease